MRVRVRVDVRRVPLDNGGLVAARLRRVLRAGSALSRAYRAHRAPHARARPLGGAPPRAVHLLRRDEVRHDDLPVVHVRPRVRVRVLQHGTLHTIL